MRKRSELRLFVAAFAATTLALVFLIEFRVVEHLSYAMEKGRLRALRDSLPDQPGDSPDLLARRTVPELVGPGVVSVEADYVAPTGNERVEDLLDAFRDALVEREPATNAPDPLQNELVPQGLGSGFVFDADKGHILTNAHVVAGAQRLRVYLADGRSTDAHVLGIDPESDLAVIQVSLGSLHALPLGDSRTARVGDDVLAIGNPFGLDGSVTKGIVSAIERRNVDIGGVAYPALLQTDAVISPGSSGGPLVNMRGEVIGINTAMATDSGRYEGVGFAIPTTYARTIVADLIQGGPGSLGVLVGAVGSTYWRDEATALGWTQSYGALVTDILPGSAAEQAKMLPMDIIFAMDGQPVEDHEYLAQAIARTSPGTQVSMEVWRDREKITVPVQVGRRYAPR